MAGKEYNSNYIPEQINELSAIRTLAEAEAIRKHETRYLDSLQTAKARPDEALGRLETGDVMGYMDEENKRYFRENAETPEQAEQLIRVYENAKKPKDNQGNISEVNPDIPIDEATKEKLIVAYTAFRLLERANQFKFHIGIATAAGLEAINWMAGDVVQPGSISSTILVPLASFTAVFKAQDLFDKGMDKMVRAIGRRMLKTMHNRQEQKYQNHEIQETSGNKT